MMEYLTPIIHLYVWLKAHPVTEALAADVLPLKEEWKATFLKEIVLNEALADADARVLLADFELDILFNAIVNALLTAVNNDRSAPLVMRFLGKDRPADIRSPILGEELDRLRTWPASLATVTSEDVKKYAASLTALVTKCDGAVQLQRSADQTLTDFTELGERKAFVDHLNAKFKLLDGKIGELMHSPEGGSLPADFRDRCFPAQGRSRGPTIKSETRTIERLKAQLARHEGILAELLTKQAASQKARDDAERAALEAEAAELKKDAASKLARIAELEKKLGNSNA